VSTTQHVQLERTDTGPSGVIGRVAALGAVVVLAVALLLLPDLRSSDPSTVGPGVLASGALEQFDGSKWTAIDRGATVPADVPLRARADGAVIDIADGQLEFTGGSLMMLGDVTIDLERGSALVNAPARWTVTAVGVTLTGNGAWRVDGGIAGRVAVYEGAAVASRPTRDVQVPRLFEVSVINGDLPAVAAPIRYLSTDPWDRRWLGDAIAIDRTVEQLQSGWQSQYPEAPQPADFYGDFAAGLDPGADGGVSDAIELLASRREGDRFGPIADVLTGIVFARALTQASGGSLAGAAVEIVGFRRAGATWGLTAMLLDLGRDDIAAAAEASLVERQDAVDAGTAVPPATEPPIEPTPQPEPSPPPSPDQPEPDPTPAPDPTDTPPEDDPGVGNSLGNIVDEVGGLVGGVLDPNQEPDVLGTLGDVLDEVGVIADGLTGPLLGG